MYRAFLHVQTMNIQNQNINRLGTDASELPQAQRPFVCWFCYESTQLYSQTGMLQNARNAQNYAENCIFIYEPRHEKISFFAYTKTKAQVSDVIFKDL